MADGSDLELQAAINAKLASDVAVIALLGSPLRLYQDVPKSAVTPYATFGATNATDDSNQCQNAVDLFIDIEIFSRAPGFEEIKRIASAIRASLHYADLTLATQRCVSIEHVRTLHRRQSETPLKEATVTFSAILEDRVPTVNRFFFEDVTDADRSTIYTSNTIEVSGIIDPVPIAVSGGSYSVNGSPFTSLTGTVESGDTVSARSTSSGSYSAAVDVVIVIGGVSDTYSITTGVDPSIGYTPSLDFSDARNSQYIALLEDV